MKYKFRLSYRVGNKFIIVNLDSIDFLTGSETDIKTIDEFTTHFDNYANMLNYLKKYNYIPNNIEELFITFDVIKDNNLYEQLYAYNKTLFFKKDKDRLCGSYVYKYFRDRFEDGEFMLKIIKHYERKFPNKNFITLKTLASAIKDAGISSLDSFEKILYYDEFDHFMDFLFTKKKKNPITNIKERKIVYKNIRDFLCFIDGETPIRVKGNNIYKTSTNKSEDFDDYIEPENITLEEYYRFNEENSAILEYFEPFRDGIDVIAPITREEMIESLNDYAKRLCFKRDNGEYE